jgi:SET domain-containing protein 6
LTQARLFQEEGALVMRAIKPINTGDEIFNDYGELPRSDLLRRYGYVTNNYAQYDVAELPLTGICHAAGFDDIEDKEYPQVCVYHSPFISSHLQDTIAQTA